MKLKNKLFLLIIALFGLFFLYSCQTTTSSDKLDAPVIALESNVISWEKVENADQYEVHINGTLVDTVEETTYTITISSYGNYTVTVKAVDSTNTYQTSDFSNSCIYVIVKQEKLASPVIKLTGSIIYWDKIQNASGYEIYINDKKVANAVNETYSLDYLEVGTYKIKILAYSTSSNYSKSYYSNEIIYDKTSEYLTISEVKNIIDMNPNGCDVSFVGRVVGFDSLGFAHVGDETGIIYVRAKHDLLQVGNIISVKGTGFVYKGSSSRPEYTRQIKEDDIVITRYDSPFINVKDFVELSNEDLLNKNINASFHGNSAIISGFVECGNSKYEFYLNDESGNHIASIHHYSMNFQNNMNDSSVNKFLELDGQYVTLKGIIYRFNTSSNLWTIQCINYEDDLVVHNNKLSKPTISYSNNLIEWEFVNNATNYHIYVDGDYYNETTTNYFDTSILDDGEHKIKIKAINQSGDYFDSDFSNEILINSKIEVDDVDFLMINDTHGSIFDGANAGISRVAELIEQLEEKQGDIIKIANGDILQGSYESNTLRGEILFKSLDILDFDAFVLGNHEFDWGLDKIKIYKDGIEDNGEVSYPILGANVIDKSTNQMVDWLDAYTIVEYGGIQVGIIGVIGSTQESSILQPMVNGYDFVDPLPIIRTLSAELRTEKGCEVVVVASHDYDEYLNSNIANLSGSSRVDTIFCAHTHQEIYDVITRYDGKKIPVVQNRDKNNSVSFVELNLDSNLNYDSYNFTRYYAYGYEQNTEFNEFLAQYQYLNDESKKVIGYNSYGFTKGFLGGIAVDEMASMFDADVAIINTGGVRASIKSGNVTIGQVFEAFPFENTVIITYLTGSKVKSLYDSNASYLYWNSDFSYSSFSNNVTYKVAVIDYVYYGTYYTEFKGTTFTDTEVLLRDILIHYIEVNY